MPSGAGQVNGKDGEFGQKVTERPQSGGGMARSDVSSDVGQLCHEALIGQIRRQNKPRLAVVRKYLGVWATVHRLYDDCIQRPRKSSAGHTGRTNFAWLAKRAQDRTGLVIYRLSSIDSGPRVPRPKSPASQHAMRPVDQPNAPPLENLCWHRETIVGRARLC